MDLFELKGANKLLKKQPNEAAEELQKIGEL